MDCYKLTRNGCELSKHLRGSESAPEGCNSSCPHFEDDNDNGVSYEEDDNKREYKEESPEVYYLVVRQGKPVSGCCKNHSDQQSAELEAERLAKKENDDFFVVKIEKIGRVTPLPQQVEWSKVQ